MKHEKCDLHGRSRGWTDKKCFHREGLYALGLQVLEVHKGQTIRCEKCPHNVMYGPSLLCLIKQFSHVKTSPQKICGEFSMSHTMWKVFHTSVCGWLFTSNMWSFLHKSNLWSIYLFYAKFSPQDKYHKKPDHKNHPFKLVRVFKYKVFLD